LVDRDFSFWPKADMTVRDSDVRFWGQSGLPLRPGECLPYSEIVAVLPWFTMPPELAMC
jgi:hypothetical protein